MFAFKYAIIYPHFIVPQFGPDSKSTLFLTSRGIVCSIILLISSGSWSVIEKQSSSCICMCGIIPFSCKSTIAFFVISAADPFDRDWETELIKSVMEQTIPLEVKNKVDFESGPNWGTIK